MEVYSNEFHIDWRGLAIGMAIAGVPYVIAFIALPINAVIDQCRLRQLRKAKKLKVPTRCC